MRGDDDDAALDDAIEQPRQQRVVGPGEAQVDDVRLQAERDLERPRQREARALRREAVVDDGPAGAQCGDADVGSDADDAFAIVDGRRDDAGDGRAVDLAVARERMLGDEIAREAHAAAQIGMVAVDRPSR